MKKDAMEHNFTICQLFGKPVLFTDDRINPLTVPPSDVHMYEIRHSDEDFGEPVTIENHIGANFFGTVLTAFELSIDDFLPLTEQDYDFFSTDQMTVVEYLSNIIPLRREPCMAFIPKELLPLMPFCGRLKCPLLNSCKHSAHIITLNNEKEG